MHRALRTDGPLPRSHSEAVLVPAHLPLTQVGDVPQAPVYHAPGEVLPLPPGTAAVVVQRPVHVRAESTTLVYVP